MPTLQTPIKHFEEDIQRAKNIVLTSEKIDDGIARNDILRSAWMFAVGASDAYFCDAYGDLIARVLRAKDAEKNIQIPNKLNNLKIPLIAVIRPSVNEAWRWRMVARELIEKESVLSLEQIRSLFNQFCRDNNKIINKDTIERWVLHKNSKHRLFGINKSDYKNLRGADKEKKNKEIVKHFEDRFEVIFQRRNDCIHNCDRPKTALQKISITQVNKAVEDIEFLVKMCQEIFVSEFPLYLESLGFSPATRNTICFA